MGLRLEIQKFAAEQTDASGVVLQSAGHVAHTADVGVEIDLLSVQGNVFLSLQFLKKTLFLPVLLLRFAVLFQLLLRRVDKKPSLVSVHNSHLSINIVAVIHADQRRDVHGAGKDRRVGIGGPVSRDKGEHPTLIQLYRLAGSKIIRHQDNRFLSGHGPGFVTGKHHDQTVGDILHIRRSGFHVLVVHSREHIREIVAGGGHRVLRVNLLGGNHVGHRLHIIQIVQHHLMHFKNHGIGLAHLFFRLFVQRLQLLLCLLSGRLKTADLRGGILHFRPLDHMILPVIKRYGANGNAAENTFSL